MKSLKFLSLWAIPLLLWVWERNYELKTDFTVKETVIGSCPLGCKDTVNITLDENCEVNLNPYMVYGDTIAACSLQLKVEIFDQQNRSLGTRITAEYKNQVLRYHLTNLKNGDNCWGNIKIQDYAPPAIVCPEPTNQALLTVYANRLEGELSDEDQAFNRSAFTCWLSNQTQESGLYYLDTIPFHVAKDGVYTFILLADFTETDRGAGGIFHQEFYTENPCQNIIGFTEGGSLVNNWQDLQDWWIQTPGLGDYLPWLNGNHNRPALRIQLELKKNEKYYLATTSLKPEDTGDFVWLVFRDEITQQPNTDILVGETIHTIPWLTSLVCDDIDRIKLSGNQCYKTDENGIVLSISDQLKNILQMTGYPHEGYAWYERGGSVMDNCGKIEVCVSDLVHDGYGSCDDVVLQRTFTAKDEFGNTTSCTQSITVRQPIHADIVLPNFTAYIECDETYPLDSLGNPHPSMTGYPFIKTAFGLHDLTKPFCNISASYNDKSRIEHCEKAFSFIRVWTIIDWCNPGNTFFYNQLIKVGDFTPPEVVCKMDADGCIPTFSTGPFTCKAAIIIPELDTITDNCSDWKVTVDVVLVKRTPIYDENNEIIDYEIEENVIITNKKPGDVINNLPLGVHYFRYRVEDGCKNVRIQHCEFEVLDLSPPVAICKDTLNVSLSNFGQLTKLYAADVNKNSYDNCSNIKIEIRRVVDSICIEEYELLTFMDEGEDNGDGGGEDGGEGGEDDGEGEDGEEGDDMPIPVDGDGGGEEDTLYYSEWGDFVYLLCCDVGKAVRVEMRVWDDADGNGIPGEYENLDYCQREILDNYNICWMDVRVEDKSKPQCKAPEDVTLDCIDPRVQYRPSFTCADSILMDSLFGRFTGIDNCNTFLICDDVLDLRDDCGVGNIIRRYHAEDESGNVSGYCEQIITIKSAHNYEIKFPADVSGQCDVVLDTVLEFKEIGCDLLALSVYDDRFIVRAGECFRIVRTFRVINWCEYDGTSQPVIIGRDEDCDGNSGDEAVYVLRRPGAKNEMPAFIDRTNNELDNNPKAGERACGGNPKGYWRKSNSNGFWQYTQWISVYDNKPPQIILSPVDLFCATRGDCQGDIGIPFLIGEDCTPGEVDFEAVIDLYNDSIDLITLERAKIKGVYPKFRYEDTHPIGDHTLEIRVSDGCGNVTIKRIPFGVADCQAPSIACINGLAAELSPVNPATDVNGDGTPDSGVAEIWASDFVKSVSDDCGSIVAYSINRVGETPDIDRKSLILTCSDAGNTLQVEIHAWDDANNPLVIKPDGTRGGANSSSCVTYILVQENLPGICADGATIETISGTVTTPEGKPISGANINVVNHTTSTNENGQYSARVAMFASDVQVLPSLNRNFLEGVSTYDIVLISQHILGTKTLDSPYKLIAADVNNSGSVSILDVILLRKLILSVQAGVENNQSWRFVDKNYRFPIPRNPWHEIFPEYLNFKQVLGPIENADFVGVKVGDVDFSATPNSARSSETKDVFSLDVKDEYLAAGQQIRVPFAANLQEILGYQFTLAFDTEALEMVDIEYNIAEAQHFGWDLLDQGLIMTSWNISNEDNKNVINASNLFSLTFKIKKSGRLSDYLHLHPRYLIPEAYNKTDNVYNLELEFDKIVDRTEFTLLQNIPNPFDNETIIPFYLPKSAKVSLQVFSSDGRLMHQASGNFDKGYQQMMINRSDLQGDGVYIYTIEVEGEKAIRKMILL
ncbi:MAG: T9SS type A sorting domain-containing protein [Saprospiraceae bacterium]|nr:T9SS type A sorting domain-containing protein [Saprospiraceae bacterium]